MTMICAHQENCSPDKHSIVQFELLWHHCREDYYHFIIIIIIITIIVIIVKVSTPLVPLVRKRKY